MNKVRYLIKNKDGKPVGVIEIFQKLDMYKLKKYDQPFNTGFMFLLKNEQFNNLDNLINDTLLRYENFIHYSKNDIEKLKYQNKFNGLTDIKRKIYTAKNEYLQNKSNKILFNKLINLYNSSKNFL